MTSASVRPSKPHNRLLRLLIAGAAALVCLALLAPLISPYPPLAVDLESAQQSPSRQHWFGTDTIGRDVFSRVMHGGRISLLIGLGATAASLGLGLLVGLTAGYCGGWIDDALSVLVDLLLSFPSLLLAIGISVLMPPGATATVVALCAAGWPSFARLFRGMVLSLKEHTYVDAARAVGCTSPRIIFVHLMPHCLPVAIVAASLKVGGFILAESALSFLGLGIQPPLGDYPLEYPARPCARVLAEPLELPYIDPVGRENLHEGLAVQRLGIHYDSIEIEKRAGGHPVMDGRAGVFIDILASRGL